jgi:hypothetical protein
MKKYMPTTNLTYQQEKELDSLIEIINTFIERLKSSKQAVSDFIGNCSFCYDLRKQRKIFERHTAMTIKSFPNFSEKTQVNLELHYFKAVNELRGLLPSAEEEIKNDYIFPINYFLLREIKKTVSSVSRAQENMANQLYPNRDNEISSNPELLKKLSETWSDLDDEY